MKISQEVLDKINSDIKRIDESANLDHDELLNLHRELDGYYQSCIANWHSGLWGEELSGYPFNYVMLRGSDRSYKVKENLYMMRAKILAFKSGLNIIDKASEASTNVTLNSTNNNTNNNPNSITNSSTNNNTSSNDININISFEEARAKVEDMTSLTDEQTKELMDKINEIEETVKSKANKKSKWEKIKPILVWLADKSFDVGMTLLPLLLQLRG